MYTRIKKEKSGYCLICFNFLFQEVSLIDFFSFKKCICEKCLSKFKILNKVEVIEGISTLFLYEYNDFIKTLIYKYKGCYDLALREVFLNQYKSYIKKKYAHYTIIFPPSNKEENIKRGFNHMQKIVETLNMPYLDLFMKKCSYKQSDHHFNERKYIKNIIKLKNKQFDTNKKYLIVDDIYTSGSTLKTIISILKSSGVKKEKIKALIISKTA